MEVKLYKMSEFEKFTAIIKAEAKEGHVVSDMPYLIAKNLEFAADWEDYISNGFADELNEYIPRITKEIARHNVISTSDCISFYAYVLYLLTDRRVITDEDIAKLNSDLAGGVGDIIFGR